jgi:mannose-1-phosphate guanylyltransferase
MNNNYGLIMAGGIGSRFWPLSTSKKPKQFLDVLGIGKSLLRLTFERMLNTVPKDQIYILTSSTYLSLVLDQLPEISEAQVLCEPLRKNTAPCIAFAAAKILKINTEATLIVSPSDHLILNQTRFNEIIQTAIKVANESNQLVTLGIAPTRPDTGYGYIEFAKDKAIQKGEATHVIQFCEKPDLETAEKFLAAGNFYWNAGIFVWRADVILKSLSDFQPKLFSLFASNLAAYDSVNESEFILHAFSECEDISIDFAVMEHAKNVSVVLSDFDWSDLGTWGSLNEHLEKDKDNNAIIGKNVFAINSENCLINMPHDKLVLVDGLKDYIVVESNNMLMILKNSNEQDLKKYLKQLEEAKSQFFKN